MWHKLQTNCRCWVHALLVTLVWSVLALTYAVLPAQSVIILNAGGIISPFRSLSVGEPFLVVVVANC